MKAAPLLALVAGSASAWVVPGAGWGAEVERARCATPSAQFGFKVQKSERLLIREVPHPTPPYPTLPHPTSAHEHTSCMRTARVVAWRCVAM